MWDGRGGDGGGGQQSRRVQQHKTRSFLQADVFGFSRPALNELHPGVLRTQNWWQSVRGLQRISAPNLSAQMTSSMGSFPCGCSRTSQSPATSINSLLPCLTGSTCLSLTPTLINNDERYSVHIPTDLHLPRESTGLDREQEPVAHQEEYCPA